jgi:N-acetylneuraminate synthase
MYGSDQAASLEPMGLVRLIRDIRMLDLIIGDGVKRVYPSEVPIMKKLRKQN